HVNVNNGTGFANAPAGTLITFSISGGPGGFDGPSTCTTLTNTGECTVQIKSTVVGTTTVHASTSVTVGGVVLGRATGDANAGDTADAGKTWEDARITISPNGTNEVGNSHTFTVLVEQNDGSAAGWQPAGGVNIASSTSFGSITGGT